MTRSDPDMLVDWNAVELVQYKSCDEILCPICMSEPSAAYVSYILC